MREKKRFESQKFNQIYNRLYKFKKQNRDTQLYNSNDFSSMHQMPAMVDLNRRYKNRQAKISLIEASTR